jgi:FMN phosphatase YigB (HAD superfamily)
MNLSPSQVVHVGDRPFDDVEGAERAGIRAILIDRTGTAPNSISRLEHLSGVLGWND